MDLQLAVANCLSVMLVQVVSYLSKGHLQLRQTYYIYIQCSVVDCTGALILIRYRRIEWKNVRRYGRGTRSVRQYAYFKFARYECRLTILTSVSLKL